jgi:hypothetical protein
MGPQKADCVDVGMAAIAQMGPKKCFPQGPPSRSWPARLRYSAYSILSAARPRSRTDFRPQRLVPE